MLTFILGVLAGPLLLMAGIYLWERRRSLSRLKTFDCAFVSYGPTYHDVVDEISEIADRLRGVVRRMKAADKAMERRPLPAMKAKLN